MPDVLPPPFVERWCSSTASAPPLSAGAEQAEVGGWLGMREAAPGGRARRRGARGRMVPGAVDPPARARARAHDRPDAPLPGAAAVDDSLLLGRFASRLVRDGFFEEDGELWAPDGTLIAQSRQLALLIGAEV